MARAGRLHCIYHLKPAHEAFNACKIRRCNKGELLKQADYLTEVLPELSNALAVGRQVPGTAG